MHKYDKTRGNFWQGAMMSGLVEATNHLAHGGNDPTKTEKEKAKLSKKHDKMVQKATKKILKDRNVTKPIIPGVYNTSLENLNYWGRQIDLGLDGYSNKKLYKTLEILERFLIEGALEKLTKYPIPFGVFGNDQYIKVFYFDKNATNKN